MTTIEVETGILFGYMEGCVEGTLLIVEISNSGLKKKEGRELLGIVEEHKSVGNFKKNH